MTTRYTSFFSPLSLRRTTNFILILHTPSPPPPTAAAVFLHNSTQFRSRRHISVASPNKIMSNFHLKSGPPYLSSNSSSSSPAAAAPEVVYKVPGLSSDEMERNREETFRRYTDSSPNAKAMRRNGKGTAIVWFRNDLRVLDNEALIKAWVCSETVLPLFCVDPRIVGSSSTTHSFGFPKTGALRAQFLIESLSDLKKNLMKLDLNLLIRHGKPEDIIPLLMKDFGVHTVYAQKETCSEEVNVERSVINGLRRVAHESQKNAKLQLVWGATMYHLDDLPFDSSCLPDVYTQYRKSVESKSRIRGCFKIPSSLGPTPKVEDWGTVPSLHQLGHHEQKVDKGMRFMGGESAALGRVNEYFWKKDLLKIYKETRNRMLGPDYSTKFSPWLASGSLSPRFIYEEVKRYEKERQSNDSTYWVLFELIWRDYFRFLSIKCGNSLFHLGGPRNVKLTWRQDKLLFESWKDGRTGYPLIDANMKELATTGFMSNRGRQIVCSFLVRDMGIDWRMGAEWFETCLLDYDPCSNYGNWTYGAGVGNDPREDRYFSIPKQAQTYDSEGKYVSFWLPELKALPREKRNFPGHLYISPIVPLKHGSFQKNNDHKGSTRRTGREGKQMKGYTR